MISGRFLSAWRWNSDVFQSSFGNQTPRFLSAESLLADERVLVAPGQGQSLRDLTAAPEQYSSRTADSAQTDFASVSDFAAEQDRFVSWTGPVQTSGTGVESTIGTAAEVAEPLVTDPGPLLNPVLKSAPFSGPPPMDSVGAFMDLGGPRAPQPLAMTAWWLKFDIEEPAPAPELQPPDMTIVW